MIFSPLATRLRWLGLVGLFCLSLDGLAAPKASFPVSQQQMQALGIRLQTLQVNETGLSKPYPGRVTLPPGQESIISAPVDGLVTEVLTQANAQVKSGQALLRLLSPDLGPLQLQLMQAASQARLASQTATRESSLFQEGIIARRRVEAAQAGLAEARATLNQARAALRLAGMSPAQIQKIERSGALEDTLTLSARKPGTVLSLDAQQGQRVPAGTPLLRVASLDTLWLDIQVPLDDARSWPVGTAVTVPGRQVQARVISQGPTVASGSQTISLRAQVLSGADQLRPGELVQAAMPVTQTSGSWDLPLSALAREGQQAYVFVRTAQGFEARPVRVLASSGQRVRVQGTLKAGERLAVSSVIALKAAWLGQGGGA